AFAPAAAAATPDAAISVSPSSAADEVGATRTITITVTPVGSTIVHGTYTASASISNSGAIANFVGPSTCTYTDTNPSCTVQVSSPAAGTSKVSATTSVLVSGASKASSPSTGSSANTANGGSDPAALTWVQGVASLNPVGASDAVGSTSTIT